MHHAKTILSKSLVVKEKGNVSSQRRMASEIKDSKLFFKEKRLGDVY